ncbi:MAG TPA: helix-turn-helix domain-containing protein [Solirubrobacterales bacterium]
MDKGFLEECLGEGLSLEAIGKRVGKHESTVSYWLKKHGLSAAQAEKHSAKGAPQKAELERLLAAGLSMREIARRLDRSLATVRHWVGRYELKSAPRRRRGSDHGPREMPSQCKQHGDTAFVREGRGYYRCKRCRNERVSQRRRTIKSKLVEEAGGKCVICGYDRCQQVLEFHHLDPGLKEFQLSHNGATRSLARSRAEARKCILLCANCHREVEAGITALPLNSVPDAVPG